MDKRSEMHRRERRRYVIGYGGSLLLTFDHVRRGLSLGD